jgi:endonuclease YncB( thermonuclease family)
MTKARLGASAVLLMLGLLSMLGITDVGLSGAETSTVLSVTGPDRVVLQYRGLAVAVSLAHVDVPEAQRQAAQKALNDMLQGKKVEVLFLPGFGVDPFGGGRVQLVADGHNVNADLAALGLARFLPGSKTEAVFEQPVKDAVAKAEKAKLGLWAAAPPPSPPAGAPAAAGTPRKGLFCSELDNAYYFAADSSDAAKANQERLIYYPDAATAERAGKKPKPASTDENLPSGTSEQDADQIFAKGKEVYSAAIAKGNTPERDELYGRAFTVLSKAMQIYSALCEKKPNDTKLGEKLHECMQLRYGAVKQRRFE